MAGLTPKVARNAPFQAVGVPSGHRCGRTLGKEKALQTANLGASAPLPAEAVLALPLVSTGLVKAPGLVANPPQKWLSGATGERVRVQGSPGFQVVYVSVDGEALAIPLDVAMQVGQAIAEHAASAQLRTLDYLRRVQ